MIKLNKKKRQDIDTKILEFIQSELTGEAILVLLNALPITKSGEEFFASTRRLQEIMVKLVNTANMYSILSESLLSIIEEKKTITPLLDLGVLTEDDFFEMLRGHYLPEEYHVGRYVLSWLIMSLTSLVVDILMILWMNSNFRIYKRRVRKALVRRKRSALKKSGYGRSFWK